MIERVLAVEVGRAVMTTFACYPERGAHPVIILFMDAYGYRAELRDMARRFAAAGYYVLVPNLYHREGVTEVGPIPEPDDEKRIARLTAFVQSLSISQVMEDTQALFALIDADPAAIAEQVGCIGYCMSGRFAVAAAARYPGRVRAAASIYGTWLTSDDTESPHRVGPTVKGELYFACAEEDHWAPLAVVSELKAVLEASPATAEVEIYPGVEHGFAFSSRHAYNRAAAERHWERLFALFRRAIG